MEINAGVVIKGTKVDGVYSADPAIDPKARRYEVISFSEALNQKLAVMDATALSLCRDNNMPIIVFNVATPGNIMRLMNGESIGTLIREESADVK